MNNNIYRVECKVADTIPSKSYIVKSSDMDSACRKVNKILYDDPRNKLKITKCEFLFKIDVETD